MSPCERTVAPSAGLADAGPPPHAIVPSAGLADAGQPPHAIAPSWKAQQRGPMDVADLPGSPVRARAYGAGGVRYGALPAHAGDGWNDR